jgi:hypothetical protein
MFGETAWGNQYAYRTTQSGALAPEVFRGGNDASRRSQAASFEEYFAAELLRNSVRPYDTHTVDELGPIPFQNHWVHSPSIALVARKQ